MEITWRWNRLSDTEKRVAELLLEGKSNKDVCGEVFLSRARIQECIRRIVRKTGADSTRDAIVLLAEERETAALLRVLEQATDGVGIVQDEVVKYANRSLARICEYTPEEMVGIPFVELLAPEVRDLQVQRYEDRMEGVPFPRSYETTILRKGGGPREVRVGSGGLVRFNGRAAMMAFVFERREVSEGEGTAAVLGRCGQPCCFLTVEGQGLQAHVAPAKLPAYCVWRQRPAGPTILD
jgi:PAS domain S-box-containing protein